MKATDKEQSSAIIIASEPLTEYRTEWEHVPENHILTISADHDMEFIPLDLGYSV